MAPQFRQQQGLTMISLLVVICLALFFAMILIKMVPTYIENYAIEQVLEDVQDDRRFGRMSRSELKAAILKRFQINGVNSFDRDQLEIKTTKRGIKVSVEYEVRKSVIGNVYIVMAFNEQVEFRP